MGYIVERGPEQKSGELVLDISSLVRFWLLDGEIQEASGCVYRKEEWSNAQTEGHSLAYGLDVSPKGLYVKT